MARDVKSMIEADEGRKTTAYPDPLTHGAPWTIGVGHTGPNVKQGDVWTDEQIDAQLAADIKNATDLCVHTMPWFGRLNDARQAALINMAFQLGSKLLQFKGMLAACRGERWHDAFGQALDSTWAKQTAKRAMRVARQLETGEWQ